MVHTGYTFFQNQELPNDPQLPVFVYGTLRPGNGNYRLLAGRTTSERTATINGFRMVTNGVFPYILNKEGSVVTGTLVEVDSSLWQETLLHLDALEGTPHHYERLVRKVKVDGQLVDAYVYIPPVDSQAQYATLTPVPGGDWENRPEVPFQYSR